MRVFKFYHIEHREFITLRMVENEFLVIRITVITCSRYVVLLGEGGRLDRIHVLVGC